MTQLSCADDYPARPIRLLVGAPAGGTTDTIARAISEPLASALKQPVLVETRAGAGGNLAAAAVAKSALDGYTLLVSFSSHTINATLYPTLPYDPVTDFTPITMVARVNKSVGRTHRSARKRSQSADRISSDETAHADDRDWRHRLITASRSREIQADDWC